MQHDETRLYFIVTFVVVVVAAVVYLINGQLLQDNIDCKAPCVSEMMTLLNFNVILITIHFYKRSFIMCAWYSM